MKKKGREPTSSRQPTEARRTHIARALERRHRLGSLDHDQIIVLPREAGRGEVRGAGPQQPPVTSSPITAAANREGEITGNLHRYGKRKAPKNDDCENYLGLSQSFFGGQIALLIFEVTSAFFWKISMVDIDEILASAIRTAWLEISGPESRSPHHIEVETAQRVRHALEREGIIITPSRPMPEAAAAKEAEGSQYARHS